MTADIMLGAITGTKLAVFTLLLMFIYMTHQATEKLDLRLWYIIGIALIIVAIGEYNYVLAVNQPDQAVVPWLNDIANLTLFSEVFYLITGIAAALFFRREQFGISSEA